jgi:uncharacterized protein YjiS (DUF1127 family)
MTDHSSYRLQTPRHGLLDAVQALVSGTAPAIIISHWAIRRRDRRALAALDEHMLEDIGITALEAHEEASKPFWRA